MALDSTHRWGRQVLQNAWPIATGQSPNLAELQIAGAVANLETSYGKGWKGEGAGSNNWGAVNCAAKAVNGVCPGGCFTAFDSSPGKAAEPRCFKVYSSPEAGAADLIKHITVRRPRSWEAMRAGNIDEFSRAMRGITGDPVYYEGTKQPGESTVELQKEGSARRHAGIVEAGVIAIAKAMGENVAATRGGGEGSLLGESPLSSSQSPGRPVTARTSLPNASKNACDAQEARRIRNSDGDPTNDIDMYPEDD